MANRGRPILGTLIRGVLIVGGLVLASRVYLLLVPHSAALGAIMVIGAGAVAAFAILHVDRRLEEHRARMVTPETPPAN